MNFQNISIPGSKVMLCTRKREERTNRQARSNIPLNFFQSWGHKTFNQHRHDCYSSASCIIIQVKYKLLELKIGSSDRWTLARKNNIDPTSEKLMSHLPSPNPHHQKVTHHLYSFNLCNVGLYTFMQFENEK